MKKFNIIHFGAGNVGKTVIKQLFENKKRLQKHNAVDLRYCGIFGSKGGFFKKTGYTEKEIKKIITRLSSPPITDSLLFMQKLNRSFLKKQFLLIRQIRIRWFRIWNMCS